MWAIWNRRSDFFLTEVEMLIFKRADICHTMDPRVVLSTPGAAAGLYGFWMQPTEDDRTRYLQPGLLAAI
jgi:hypothetical protein